MVRIVPLFFLLLFGCKNPVQVKEAPAKNELGKNQTFCIILPEKHSDGATWQISDNYDTKIVERMNDVWHGPDKGIYFNLKTKNAGTTKLHFVKRKYSDTLDSKDFNINVY